MSDDLLVVVESCFECPFNQTVNNYFHCHHPGRKSEKVEWLTEERWKEIESKSKLPRGCTLLYHEQTIVK